MQLDTEVLPPNPISGRPFHHLWSGLADPDPFISYHDCNDILFYSLGLKRPDAI
jgi:hypothetical protein